MLWKDELNIHTKNSEEFFDEQGFREIKANFIGRVVTIIIASLSLISALAWEDALHDLYNRYFTNSQTIGGKLGYAVTLTFLAVIVSAIVGRRFLKKARKK